MPFPPRYYEKKARRVPEVSDFDMYPISKYLLISGRRGCE
jgi:hypothetical protein